ncbi:MAG: hypothetical protein R2844_15775 [Caldilineales bacterium]
MNKRPWPARIVRAALFVLVVLILLPQPGYRGQAAALLSPAQYAVDLASLSGDVNPASTVFGLGPLTRLATRAPGLGHGWALAFDLLVAAAVVYGVYLLFRRARSPEALLGILAGALVVEGVRSYVFPLAVLLWLVLLVDVLDYVQRETLLSLLAAAGLSWSLFYLQSSVGLAAMGMLAAVLLFRLIRPAARSRRFTGSALGVWALLGPLMALLLGIDLPAHAANALRLRSFVAAPAPALPIGKSNGSEFLLLAVVILLVFAGTLIASRQALRRHAADWLACGLVGALLLLAFREAFVRPWGHPWLFFQAAMAVGILALFVAKPEATRRFGGAFAAVLILSFPAVSGNVRGEYATARVASLRSYAAWALNTAQPAAGDPRLEGYLLPARLLEIIGDGTVDATADALPYVIANNLAFQPSAAIRSLADLPVEIGRDTGPRFIMLGLGNDPAHDPFPSGSPDSLELLQDYRQVWRLGDAFVLLERLPRPRPVELVDTQSGIGQLGEAVELSSPGGIQRLQVDPELNLAGRLSQALALTPQIDLVVLYAGGEQATVRLTANQLRSGVQLAPAIDDLADVELFSAASGILNRRVEQFWLEPAQPWAFGSRFDYVVDRYVAGNAARNPWPSVALDDGQQARLMAVQYDRVGNLAALDLFWDLVPNGNASASAQPPTVFARLLDLDGNPVATAEGDLRDGVSGVRTLIGDQRSYLATRLLLPLPADADGAIYDLQVGLAPAGQPPESAVWQALLPRFVEAPPQG